MKILPKREKLVVKIKKEKIQQLGVYLYELQNDTYIADTPGFSTFDIYEIQSKDLEKYYIEFKPYISKCEFVGCTHQKEEKCGIKQAINEGKISKDRYERFVQIYNALKEREDKRW